MRTDRYFRAVLGAGAVLAASLACNAVTDQFLPPQQATATPAGLVRAASPQPVDCTDESCLDACLARIADVLPRQSFDPLSEVYARNDASMTLVVYDVTEGRLSEPLLLYVPDDFKSYQADLPTQQRVWDYTYALLPGGHRKWLAHYKIFTDGPGNILAWVSPEYTDPGQWTLGVDVVDSGEPFFLTETLVHEIGHLITLNADQIPLSDHYYGWWKQDHAVCEQFLTADGCSGAESYINLYYEWFWVDLYDDWLKQVVEPLPDSPEESEALVHDFYSDHRESFGREYAATNIYEDMAESFTAFVLEPKPEGNTQVDQKSLFFYKFPELVQIRLDMIQAICGYLK